MDGVAVPSPFGYSGGMFVLWFAACQGDDWDAAPGPSPSLEPTAVPVLTVATPARGAFVGDRERIEVSGEVTPGTGAITTLVVNGNAIDMGPGGGAFSKDIAVGPGIAILGTRVETADGERAVDGRAVMVGEVHEPGERLSESVKIQLGAELLDDDDDDLDDLATVAETMFADPAIARSFVGTEYVTEYYTLVITGVSFGGVEVDLVPSSGTLDVTLTIRDVWIDFDAIGNSWYIPDTHGSCWADAAVIDISLDLSIEDGVVTAVPTSTVVTLQNFGMTLAWFPDSYEDELADYARDYLEDELAVQVADMIPPLVEEYLGAFSVDTTFSGMRLQMALSSLRVASDGLRLTMDAWVSGPAEIDLPDGAGSLATDEEGPGFPLSDTAPFAMAADDDFLNQLLFQMWAGGSLGGITFGAVEMTALAGAVPAPLGPVATVAVDVGLPPVFGEASWEGMQFDLSLGELRMAVTREDGVLTDASINVRTGGTLAITDAGELAFTLDNRPAYMLLEIGMEAWPEALDPGDMAALVRLSVPPLFGTLSSFLPGFPVPSVPLDSFGDAFAGESLSIQDPSARVERGWLVIEGSLSAE